MKRIISLILCFVMILSFAACAQEQSGETQTIDENKTVEKEELKDETKETEEEKKEVVYATVNEPLTWDRINAIPVANASMSIDELRQICIDLISLQVSFTWVPEETLTYLVDRHGVNVTIEEGVLRGGIPYVNVASGNVYRIMRYYDPETGHLDISQLGIDKERFGTACSGSACWGWGRVVNSARLSWTGNMTPANGFIPVGPYQTVGPDVTQFGHAFDGDPNPATDCSDIANLNGSQVMYESYALMHKADGLVNNGHVTMCSSEPVVVRKADGSIDGEESYLLWCEQGLYQTGASHTRTQADGTSYQIQGNVNLKRTFASLFKDSYLPFTFAEFLGTDPVEKGEAYLVKENGERVSGTGFSAGEIQTFKLESNYNISDVYTTIRDPQGNVVVDYFKASANHFVRSFDMKSAFPAPAIPQFVKGDGYTVEISAMISTGEKIVVYSSNIAAK